MAEADEKLVEFIKDSLAQGRSREDIYKELLAQGWTIEIIQAGFEAINTKQEERPKDKHQEKQLQEKREDDDLATKTIQIIVTIGALFVGVGMFSLVAANWSGMEKPTRVLVILVAMVVSYGAGWYLKEKLKLQKTGEALFLLGSIIYGAGIFLVAQMFNVRANWPDGFILWMIGTIAMAFAIQSYPLFYLAIPLGAIAILGEPFVFVNVNSFVFTPSFLLLAATIVSFVTGMIIKQKIPKEFKDFY